MDRFAFEVSINAIFLTGVCVYFYRKIFYKKNMFKKFGKETQDEVIQVEETITQSEFKEYSVAYKFKNEFGTVIFGRAVVSSRIYNVGDIIHIVYRTDRQDTSEIK